MTYEASAAVQPRWHRTGRLLALWALIAASLSGAAWDMSSWRLLGVAGIAVLAVAWLVWDLRQGWRPLISEQGDLIICGGFIVLGFADGLWIKLLGLIVLGVGLFLAWLL